MRKLPCLQGVMGKFKIAYFWSISTKKFHFTLRYQLKRLFDFVRFLFIQFYDSMKNFVKFHYVTQMYIMIVLLIIIIWPMADRFWLNDYLSCWFFAVSCNYMWSKGILYCNGLAPYWNLSPCLWGTWIFIVQCYSWFVHIKQCKLHLWRRQRCTLPSGCKVSKFWPCDGMYQHVTHFQI